MRDHVRRLRLELHGIATGMIRGASIDISM
jgi:hypothetical protein